MVLQRTIEDLRERPRHEREAVAFWIAVAVVIILLIGWGIFFFRSIGSPDLQPVNDAYTKAVDQMKAQQGETPVPANDTGWVSTATQPAASAAASDQIQIIQEDVPSESADTQQ